MADPIPGWYPDPHTSEMVRWWDGAGWTDHVQQRPTAAVATIEPDPTSERAAPTEDDGMADAPIVGGATVVADPEEVEPAVAESPAEEPADEDPPTAASNGRWASGLDAEAGDDADTERRPNRMGMFVTSAGIVLAVVSLFLPWMASPYGSGGAFDPGLPWAFSGGSLESGSEGLFAHGWVFVLMLGAVAATMLSHLGGRVTATAVGLMVLVLTAANYLTFNAAVDDFPGVELSVGSGVFVMALSGLVVMTGGRLLEE